MTLAPLLGNYVLVSALVSWSLAQMLKIPIEFLRTRRWNWALLFSAGGMPSSHSALAASTALAVGLREGFDSPLFAMAVAFSMIVIYDATGIRRQAGRHAALINAMIADLASGHPLKEEHLREVLGHTPFQAIMGMLLGLLIARVAWDIFERP